MRHFNQFGGHNERIMCDLVKEGSAWLGRRQLLSNNFISS